MPYWDAVNIVGGDPNLLAQIESQPLLSPRLGRLAWSGLVSVKQIG
jgi:hypothetical protein